MAILNEKIHGEGTRRAAASANIYYPDGYVGIGSQLQINAETFDANGGSQGIQGLDYTIDGSELDYSVEKGGIHVYDLMKGFAKAIMNGWSPEVRIYPEQTTREQAFIRIKPVVGSELVRIRDWVWVPVAPTPAITSED